jgi:hypothetical protein
MNKILVLIIHGIGKNSAGYAEPFIKAIRNEFDAQIKNILHSTEDYSKEIELKEVVWDDILGEKQEKLKTLLEKQFTISQLTPPRNIFMKIIFFIAKFFDTWLRTTFAAEFVGDIISYKDQDAITKIYQKITDKLNEIGKAQLGRNLTIVAHSLGTVISVDYIREQQNNIGYLNDKTILNNLFTIGSPLALFSLDYSRPDIFKKPIKIEDQNGRWINILDEDDPIGYSIKNLDENFEKAVFKDQKVEVGGYGVAHIKYWTDQKVHTIIAKKLAIDWLNFNKKLDKAAIEKFYKEYDDNLGLY